jgi:GH25 family lysozyme M1 (1,4-beta-N-acetylmuramidase)
LSKARDQNVTLMQLRQYTTTGHVPGIGGDVGRNVALSWPDEILIGSYRTRTEAAEAISAVHQSRQKTGSKQ